MDERSRIEASLFNCYQIQLELYSQLLEKAHKLPQAFSGGDDRDILLEAMAVDLERIAATERDAQDHAAKLTAAGYSMGHPLRDVIQNKKHLLEELLQQIEVAESSAVSARAKLIPEVDAHTRARQMRDAYATSRHDV